MGMKGVLNDLQLIVGSRFGDLILGYVNMVAEREERQGSVKPIHESELPCMKIGGLVV